jgi:hypothetical protein
MKNGRCRLHGGLSTGPKTAEGIERIRQAGTKHGRYSAAEIEREQYRALLREGRELVAGFGRSLKDEASVTRTYRD